MMQPATIVSLAVPGLLIAGGTLFDSDEFGVLTESVSEPVGESMAEPDVEFEPSDEVRSDELLLPPFERLLLAVRVAGESDEFVAVSDV
jgi:hypothetical protein